MAACLSLFLTTDWPVVPRHFQGTPIELRNLAPRGEPPKPPRQPSPAASTPETARLPRASHLIL